MTLFKGQTEGKMELLRTFTWDRICYDGAQWIPASKDWEKTAAQTSACDPASLESACAGAVAVLMMTPGDPGQFWFRMSLAPCSTEERNCFLNTLRNCYILGRDVFQQQWPEHKRAIKPHVWGQPRLQQAPHQAVALVTTTASGCQGHSEPVVQGQGLQGF